ncbi:hypothetical protein BH23ACT9_BH23ACT9_30950 [soil metagenome]
MTPLFGRVLDSLDRRMGVRKDLRALGSKVFPAHWSFLLGEVALVSFAVLLATGVFLAFFYRPSIDPVLYEGSAALYQGRTVPAAFDSILRLSHDVPGGLLMRRIHRAASHVFVAAMLAHFLRIILTGAFRRPRDVNYLVGSVLMVAVVIQGYTGHNLPWDVLAGTSMRIAYTFAVSIPWVGPQIATWVFGGAFPGDDIIPRMYVLHVFVLPALISGLIGLHLLLIARQSHTQTPRPGVDASATVVGDPLWPNQAAKSTTMALGLVSILATSAVLVPWSDLDLHGPFQVGHTTNAAQPDWFLFWVEGALRLYPGLDIHIPGGALTGPFIVGVAFPLLWMLLIALYPVIERRLTGDAGHHDALQHPLDVPARAGLVAGALTMMAVLTVAAGNDIIARLLGAPTEAVVVALRILLFTAPPAVGVAVAAYARRQPRRWVEPAPARNGHSAPAGDGHSAPARDDGARAEEVTG